MKYTHEQKEALLKAMLNHCEYMMTLYNFDSIHYWIWDRLYCYLRDNWWFKLCDLYLEEFEIWEHDLDPNYKGDKNFDEFLKGLYMQALDDFNPERSFKKYIVNRLYN